MVRGLGIALFLTAILPLPVCAQTPAQDAEARALFEAGRVAFVDERFGDALGYFQRSYELSRRPELLYNIATSLDRLDRDDEAITQYEAFLTAIPDAANRRDVELRVSVLRSRAERAAAERAATEAAAREAAARDAAARDAAAREAAAARERARVAEEAEHAEEAAAPATMDTLDVDFDAPRREHLERPTEGRTIRAGDPVDAPPPQGGGDVTSEAWFWVVIGAVVVGAGVGITVGVLAGQDPGETPYITENGMVIYTLTGSF